MIDQFSIFHRGGAVLWERQLTVVSGFPVDSLIQSVLLEERGASSSFRHDRYQLRWTFANELELVFVAVYLNFTNLLYIDDLLDRVKADFLKAVHAATGGGGGGWAALGGLSALPARVDFDAQFDRIARHYEMEHLRGRGSGRGPRTFEEVKKAAGQPKAAHKKKSAAQRGQPAGEDDEDDDDDETEVLSDDAAVKSDADSSSSTTIIPSSDGAAVDSFLPPSSSSPPHPSADVPKGLNVEKLRQMQALAMRGGPRPMRSGPPSKKKGGGKDAALSPSDAAGDADGKKKRVKQATKWADKISREDAQALDRSKRPTSGSEGEDDGKAGTAGTQLDGVELAKKYGFIDQNDTDTIPSYSDDDEDVDAEIDEDDAEDADAAAADPAKRGRFSSSVFSLFSRLAGTSVLTRAELDPVLAQFKSSLMAKNVAHEIAEKLCDSVAVSLEGKKLGYSTVRSTVYRAIEDALTRILTPSKQTDIAQGIVEAKAAGRPYSIVFLGVNGVGTAARTAHTARDDKTAGANRLCAHRTCSALVSVLRVRGC